MVQIASQKIFRNYYQFHKCDKLNFDDEYYKNRIFPDKPNVLQDSNSFQKLCKKYNLTKTVHDIIYEERFIEIIDKIHNKYPLLFMPTFIEEFIGGVWSKTLIDKYDLNTPFELDYIKTAILKLHGKRKKNVNAKSLNLLNNEWRNTYDFLTQCCKKYEKLLLIMYNHDLIISIIILYLFSNDSDEIDSNLIIQDIKSIVKENIGLLRISDNKEISDGLITYVDSLTSNDYDDIFLHLHNLNHISYNSSKTIKLIKNSNKISEDILQFLDESENGLTYFQLYRKLAGDNLILKLIPSVKLIDMIIKEYEKTEKITRKQGFWIGRPYNDQLFLKTKYETIIKNKSNKYNRKFFGRTINSDLFVNELLQLQKGDFEDVDDQVTRIAGIFISDSNSLMGPHENHDIFDFAVDVSNYKPKNINSNIFDGIDLNAEYKIIHVKIMISETITNSIFDKIRAQLPNNERLIIFTFNPILSLKIENMIIGYDNIDIVNEKILRQWIGNEIIIPCRIGSLARIRYGDYVGRYVRVDSINYESGMASVMILPDTDATVFIGTLEEIKDKCPV